MKASVKSRVIGSLLSVVIVLVLYWFMLPPINPTSPAFWIFIIISLAVFLAVLGFGELLSAGIVVPVCVAIYFGVLLLTKDETMLFLSKKVLSTLLGRFKKK